MAFAKILCAVDFSAGSRGALHVAARLARDLRSELAIVHAWGRLAPLVATDPVLTLGVDIAGEARQQLAVARRDAVALGASRVTEHLVEGAASSAIVNLLESDPSFDLVVVGTHGRTGLARVLLGSVAEQVVRHAPCSILVVRREVERFAKILCPTDFSESARFALELAGGIVAPGGTLTLAHVVERPAAPLLEDPMVGSNLEVESERLEQWVAKARTRLAVPIQSNISMGDPDRELLAMIDPSVDLVAMGSQGRTGLSRAILGSHAEALVRRAPCAVLVARHWHTAS